MSEPKFKPGAKVNWHAEPRPSGAVFHSDLTATTIGYDASGAPMWEVRGESLALTHQGGVTWVYEAYLWPAEPAPAPEEPRCTCDLHTVLMVTGCRCGQMERERAA